ncbi:MAG: hypothetical protein ACREL3_08830 [Gemmatimonadales bacterium]
MNEVVNQVDVDANFSRAARCVGSVRPHGIAVQAKELEITVPTKKHSQTTLTAAAKADQPVRD